MLSRLTSPEALAGDAVDYAARKLMLHLSKGGVLPQEGRIVEVGLGRYDQRLSHRAHHMRNVCEGQDIPRYIELTVLQHEYYSHHPSFDVRIGQMRERVEDRLRNLAGSDLLARLSTLPPSSILLPSPGRPRPRLLRNVLVYAKPDLLLQVPDGLVVIDWKAGKDTHQTRTEAGWQLAGYSAVEGQQASVSNDDVAVQAAFLTSAPSWNPQPVPCGDLSTLERRIGEDLRQEHEFAQEADACRASLSDWKKSFPAKPLANLCARCPFLELCSDGISASSSIRLPRNLSLN